MVKEEKLDIEDIKDPEEEIDLDEAISEDEAKEVSSDDDKEELKEEIDSDEPDALEAAESEAFEEVEADEVKPEKPKKKRSINWKIVAIVFITILVTGVLVLGGIYYYNKKKQANTPAPEPTPTNNVEINVTSPAKTEKNVYTNAEGGLNLREEPSTSAKILATIPYGTKLDVTTTQGTWYKTSYNSQAGWIDSAYTQTENPLVYSNNDYGFQLTFLPSWAGYKMTPKTIENMPVYYASLPTTDKSWVDSSAPVGYASMFAISVYTKDQWQKASAEEGPKPTYLGEKGNYVFAWSPAQDGPSDLNARYQENKQIIATFKVI